MQLLKYLHYTYRPRRSIQKIKISRLRSTIPPTKTLLSTTDNPPASKHSALRKASLFYLVFVMFSYTTGGPFGLEDMVTTSGPGMTLIYLLVLPFFWCIPVSLVSA